MKTVIISFSARKNGNCAQIGKYIQKLVQDPVLFEFSERSIHACGGCDYECFTDQTKCPYKDDMECEILDAIVQSEMTYFILPNYSDYPCSNYFVFNERSQCYFQGKPKLLDDYLKVPKRSIVVSNTNTENFSKALAYQTEQTPDILFLSAKHYGKKSIKGDLATSKEVLDDIAAFVSKI